MYLFPPFTPSADTSDGASRLGALKSPAWLSLATIVAMVGLGVVVGTWITPALLSGATGSILLQSNPAGGIKVTLDGKEIAQRTPLIVRNLSTGNHSVKISAPKFEPQEQAIQVENGALTRIGMDLVKLAPRLGSIKIEVQPTDATIKVNGQPQKPGQTISMKLDEAITVTARRRHHHSVTRRVLLKDELPRTVTIVLEPLEATLIVDSRPNGTVYLNGFRRGRSPVTLNGLDLNKEWTVRIESKGYKPFVKILDIGKRQLVSLDATLKRE